MLTGKKLKEKEAYDRRHAKEGGGESWKEERATQEVHETGVRGVVTGVKQLPRALILQSRKIDYSIYK